MFTDRIEAGRKLALELLEYSGNDAIVIAIPRGGVVTGYEVAHQLGVPLDIIIPRKIGAPNNPELAIGAITEDGSIILDRRLTGHLQVPEWYIREESERQRSEIRRRVKYYRGDGTQSNLKDRNVIVVDDGIATGATIKAAMASIRKQGPRSLVIAVPVAPSSTIQELKRKADRVVCLFTPEPFYAIGQFYRDFSQTSDNEVVRLLQCNRREIEGN